MFSILCRYLSTHFCSPTQCSLQCAKIRMWLYAKMLCEIVVSKLKLSMFIFYENNHFKGSLANSISPTKHKNNAQTFLWLSDTKMHVHRICTNGLSYLMSQTLTVLSTDVVMTIHGSLGLNWMLVTLLRCSLARQTSSPR